MSILIAADSRIIVVRDRGLKAGASAAPDHAASFGAR
jgi:hypothetical protein